MAKNKYELIQFSGGMTDFEKLAVPGSSTLLQALDIHQDPNFMLPSQAPSKVSGSVCTDLPLWMVDCQPYTSDRYAYGDTGQIYKINSSDTVTVDRTIGSFQPAGQGLSVLDNFLYYATNTTLGRKGPLSGTPTYDDNFIYTIGLGTDPGLKASQTKSGQTYTIPTSISEATTDSCPFTPTRDPLATIQIIPTSRGTGNWTVTVHDVNNILIATKTVANASLTNGVLNSFTFTIAEGRVVPNQIYHFHVTSTVNDGTVQTGTSADLSTADFVTFFTPLVPTTVFHPMFNLNGLNIGNGEYIGTWDETSYNPNKIFIDRGFKIRTLHQENQYLVATAYKGPNIDSATEARMYYWDTIQPVFNFSVPVENGAVNVASSFKNRTVTVIGSETQLYLGSNPFQPIITVPTYTNGKKVEVYPGAMDKWRGRLFIGFAGSTDDSNILLGAYGYGNAKDSLPEALTYDFQASSGVLTGTTVRVGMVKSFGKDLYISYFDGVTNFIDKVQKANNPAASGQWTSLILDGGAANKLTSWGRIVLTFAALTSGQTITPFYIPDRGMTVTGPTQSTVGATYALQEINIQSKEIQIGFTYTSSGSSYMKFISAVLEYNDLTEEETNIPTTP